MELAQGFRKFDRNTPCEKFPNFKKANLATEEIDTEKKAITRHVLFDFSTTGVKLFISR